MFKLETLGRRRRLLAKTSLKVERDAPSEEEDSWKDVDAEKNVCFRTSEPITDPAAGG